MMFKTGTILNAFQASKTVLGPGFSRQLGLEEASCRASFFVFNCNIHFSTKISRRLSGSLILACHGRHKILVFRLRNAFKIVPVLDIILEADFFTFST